MAMVGGEVWVRRSNKRGDKDKESFYSCGGVPWQR